MNEEDFKKLLIDATESLKKEIRSVKDVTEIIQKEVDSQGLNISVTAENVRRVKDQQSV